MTLTVEYVKPVPRIRTLDDLNLWKESSTFQELVEFVSILQDLVEGKPNDAEVADSQIGNLILELLDKVEEVANKHPVQKERDISRFGKIEFRDFYDELEERCNEFLKPIVLLKDPAGKSLLEVSSYFVESWGNRRRIDYGSGHEMNFILYLLCLQKLEVLGKSDYSFVVLKVFNRYMKIMRKLQKEYWLEPAGSHGVWGLDDYHFLPFLFGASQLSTHPHFRPRLIHNVEVVESFHQQYMYFECIHFVNNIKTLPKNQDQKLSLRWHSPMLDDILSAKTWLKIKEGMVKMYCAEVLSKLPITQHVMFGSLIECPSGIREHLEQDAESHGLEHSHNTWGDCCGIRIPSAIAASESMRSVGVPFD